MKFCTALNCMDGRGQLPVIQYLQKRFDAEYVDMINEAGICLVLSENKDKYLLDNIFKKVAISINNHSSKSIAIVGHYDCALNNVGRDVQVEQIKIAITLLRNKYKNIEIIGLWLNEDFLVEEVGFPKEI